MAESLPKKTILVLQHHPDYRETCRKMIEAAGWKAITAANGLEAIPLLYGHVPDVVIADTQLPEMNGYQICRLIKHEPATRHIPVILLSGENEKLDKFWGFKTGADDFLSYPDVAEKLVHHVAILLNIQDPPSNNALSSLSKQPLTDQPDRIRARLTQILDKSLIETTLMMEFRHLNDMTHDRNLLSYMLLNLMGSLIDYDLAAVFFNDRNREPRLVTFHLPPGKALSTQTLKDLKSGFFIQVTPQEALPRQFDALEFDMVGELDEKVGSPGFNTCYFQEFFIEQDLIGAMALYHKETKDYSRMFPMTLIEQEVKLLMKLRYFYSQAETLAITDGLTGLFNYRHFNLYLDREFRRARRYRLNLSLALIDIDHFREFNDKWGHLLGDEVLKHVADIAMHCFRHVDFIARYGGEELVVVFPETSLHAAQTACERFRWMVADTPLVWEDQVLHSTVSIGLNQLSQQTENTEDFIRLVDQSLYDAKRQGRNQIVAS